MLYCFCRQDHTLPRQGCSKTDKPFIVILLDDKVKWRIWKREVVVPCIPCFKRWNMRNFTLFVRKSTKFCFNMHQEIENKSKHVPDIKRVYLKKNQNCEILNWRNSEIRILQFPTGYTSQYQTNRHVPFCATTHKCLE